MSIEHLPFELTKTVATLGPACDSAAGMGRLIEEGARVFRVNFSHGTPAEHAALLAAAREAAAEAGVPVAILGDLSGPKIRVGDIGPTPVDVHEGDRVDLVGAGAPPPEGPDPPAAELPVTLAGVTDSIEAGQRVLVNDGAVRMIAIDTFRAGPEARVECRVTTGGPIATAKGVNLPDTDLDLPSLTDHDRRCVDWAIDHELDYLALSFVRSAQDVRALREILDAGTTKTGQPTPVIAKIEKPQALDDLEGIIDEADGVMVARGDLGVEMDVAQVPLLQKRIVRRAHDWGKPVIVATQMLQSMIESPHPTRAEVSDVAQAILDGADAVMLSGETAIGRYPDRAARMIRRVALATETHIAGDHDRLLAPPKKLQASRYRTAALAHGVAAIVRDMRIELIAIWSQRGGGARYLSQNRMAIPVVAASSEAAVVRRMALLRGIVPVHMERPADTATFADRISELLVAQGWAREGQTIVVVAGEPIGNPGVTNAAMIHQVGDVCRVGGGGS